MNKKVKSGFSLAEVLIALAIISVIATMGFSIAKKGIANAYQGYYYAGYQGMDSAIKIAVKEIYVDTYPNKPNNSMQLQENFINHLVNLLNLRKVDEANNNNNSGKVIRYKAPNGIEFAIKYDTPGNIDNPGEMEITMKVPSVKTELINNTYRIVDLKYDPDPAYKYLIPGNCLKQTSYLTCPSYSEDKIKKGYVDISNREDLVAFSYNDGSQQPFTTSVNCDENGNCTESEPTPNPNYNNPLYRGYGSYKDTLGDNVKKDYIIKLVNPEYAY